MNLSVCCVYTRVSPFYKCFSVCRRSGDWFSCPFFSALSDAVKGSTIGVHSLHRETKFVIGFDFAVTLSSPESFCVLFEITSEQAVELKWHLYHTTPNTLPGNIRARTGTCGHVWLTPCRLATGKMHYHLRVIAKELAQRQLCHNSERIHDSFVVAHDRGAVYHLAQDAPVSYRMGALSHLILFAFCSTSLLTLCRTEMANVNQTQKMIPFITCEISLGQYVCEFVFVVNVFDLDFGVQINSIKQPIKSNSVPGNMSHCRASPFYGHLDQCFVVFNDVQ